jgi:hypothetical protein
MRTYATTALIMAALIMPPRYFLARDVVGNCAVVDAKPSAQSGLTIIGDKLGYDSKEAAADAIRESAKGKCKGIVG